MAITAESTAEETVDPVAVVYPNPTKDLVTINIKNATQLSTDIQIIDAYGKMYRAVGKKLSDVTLQVDLSRYSSGIYFIRVLVDNEYKIYRVMKM